MLLPRGSACHAVLAPASVNNVPAGTVVLSLAGGRLAWVGKSALLEFFRQILAVAQGDFDALGMLGLALILMILHLLTEELFTSRLTLLPRAAGRVREDHVKVLWLRTYG